MIQHIQQKEIEICALMFDGFMVYGDYYKDENLLKELEEVIQEYGVKLSYKEHNQDLIVDGEPEGLNLSEHKMALKVLELFPHWKYCDELYAFDITSGLWTSNHSRHFEIIHALFSPTINTAVLKTKLLSSICIFIQGLTLDEDWLNKRRIPHLVMCVLITAMLINLENSILLILISSFLIKSNVIM
jgi:hypothetical protein